MTDKLSKEERSIHMGRIRGTDTKAELTVRRLVHRMGYRYRLHRRDLPGTPDIVLPGRKKVIFVNGCFWHQHPDSNCKLARMPKSRLEYWKPKLAGNRSRDQINRDRLRKLGWGVFIIWECEIAHIEDVEERVHDFLEGTSIFSSGLVVGPDGAPFEGESHARRG